MQLRVPGWSRPLKACSTLALLILAENPGLGGPEFRVAIKIGRAHV